MPFPRPCDRCGKKFQPQKSRLQHLCPACLKMVKDVNFIKLICSKKGIGIQKLNQLW